jgi:3-hydroxybutyrate dehydrogenase
LCLLYVSGFGHELAKELVTHGCHVIATCFRPEGPGAQALKDFRSDSDRMTVLPLDVSSDDSVAECLNHVRQLCKNTGKDNMNIVGPG